ncbi:MAG: DNRLRE domain-containing protein, partial [Dermatophilaceae bacterium]
MSYSFSDGRVHPGSRFFAAATALALAVTVGSAVEPGRAVAAAVVVAPGVVKVVSRADVVSAQVTARVQGSRVEVESLREESSSTWVNPDGTLTTEQHFGPVRFRDAAGGWRGVDLSLVELPDGTVAPRGHPAGLSLAGGGAGAGKGTGSASETDLTVTRERKGARAQARDVTVAWPGRLGRPTLDGAAATYPEVQPGVDLVVQARRTGFEQHVVLKTPAALAGLKAARGGQDLSWSLPVKTNGLTARAEADGSVSFVDADGQVASQLAAPVAWDAQVDARSGEHTSTSPVRMSVAQRGKNRAVVTLTPDQGWLSDPARVFPLTIDPTYAATQITTNFDTYVSSAFPSATYSTATELRVGTYNGGGDKYRSFLNFPISTLQGKQVQSATLSLFEFHSYSCTATPFYVSSAAPAAGASTSWSNQPTAGTSYGSASVAKGFSSSCAGGRVSVPLTSMLQSWAGTGWSNGTIRLHASESDSNGWKKFYSLESSQDPYLTYTYNRKPNLAAAPSLQSPPGTSFTPIGSSTPMLFTTDPTPTLRTTISDPDGSGVYSNIEVHTDTTGASKVANCVTSKSPYTPSGGVASCSLPTALANNGTYYLRASAGDEKTLSNGAWSAWTKFYTAYTNPPAPAVTCPGYTNGAWSDTAPGADVVCTVTAAGAPGDYATPGFVDLSVDGVALDRRKIPVSNDPNVAKTTITIPRLKPDKTPNVGAHLISATAVARTLKTASTTFGFGWGGASVSLPTVGTASSGKITVAAGGPPRGNSATVSGKIQWRIAGSGNETTGWTDGPAVPVTSTSATTAVSASGTFALSNAVREAGASADVPNRTPVLLDVQFCFSYAGVATAQCTWSQSPRSVTRVPHAFGGGYPVAGAGPGQVALFTGEYNQSATDVSVPGYSGDLAISRSHTSFDGDGSVANWPVEPVTGVFGPGWTASLQGPEAGVAGLQVIDNTRQDGTIVLVDEEGSPLVYRNPDKTRAYKPGAPYLPATTDTTEAAADLQINGTVGATMTMTFKQEDGTVTTWAPVAYSAGADTDWKPVSVNEPGQVGSTTYGHDGTGRVTRIVAAVPPNGATPPAAAVTCPTSGDLVAPQYRGCRALDITYATANSATFPGDYAGRVKAITATLWDPEAAAGAGAMTNTTVATYTYDITGRLVQVRDPRTTLGTDYTWSGTSTRLAAVKQSGMAAYNLSYDATPGTPRVAAVTRDNPTTGTGSPVTLARYTYGVALSGTGLPDLTGTAVDDWYQGSAPATGYAVFGPDYIGPTGGAGVDWSRADLQYADENGYTVNTASYGAGAWQVTATDYDTTGNVVRGLDAGATKIVRDAASGSTPLGSGQVDALSTQSVYNTDITGTVDEDGAGPLAPVTKVVTPAGTLVTDTYGPTRTAALVSDLNSDGLPDVLPVRPHTKTVYDFNAPTSPNGAGINPANNEPWRLPTTITTGIAAAGQVDLETTFTTVNSYAKLSAGDATEGDPWAIGTPTKVTTGGITATTRFDNEGKTTEARQPLSTGIDAGTTKTNFYTAGVNAADTSCGTNIEWAGLACRTYPAAAPTAGAGGAATLPDSRTTAYNAWLQPLTVVETSGTATRTTQTQYDTAGRTTATWTTTSGVTGSTASPGTFTHYIPPGQTAAGSVDYSGNLNAAKTDADPTARTSTTYDAWGRTLTATNDLGDVTTTTYVAIGQPGAGSLASVVENPAAAGQPDQTTAYTYDGAGSPEGKDADNNLERRGQLTGMTITRAGAAGGTGTLDFAAAYDADGKLVTQKLPGQVTQRTSYDEAGEPSGLTYSGSVQPVKIRLDTEGTPVADEFGNPIYDPDG